MDEFKAALEKAKQELANIENQEKALAARKSQLVQTIAGLAPLCGEAPPASAMTLSDAIRVALANSTKPLSPTDVRDVLVLMRYDLRQYGNVMASIHTALRRMLAAGEVEIAGDIDFGGGYKKKMAPADIINMLAGGLKAPKKK